METAHAIGVGGRRLPPRQPPRPRLRPGDAPGRPRPPGGARRARPPRARPVAADRERRRPRGDDGRVAGGAADRSSTSWASPIGSASAWTRATCSRRATTSARRRTWTPCSTRWTSGSASTGCAALHVNDSKMPFDSRRDRHENVGEGEIGERMAAFLGCPRLQELPAVMETAGQDGHGPGAGGHEDAAPPAPEGRHGSGRSWRPRDRRRAAAAAVRAALPVQPQRRPRRPARQHLQHARRAGVRPGGVAVAVRARARARPAAGCARRLDADGHLRIVAQDERSQTRNRSLAIERFTEAMRAALAPPPPPRRPTRPSAAARERRLHSKRRDRPDQARPAAALRRRVTRYPWTTTGAPSGTVFCSRRSAAVPTRTQPRLA